ncbi:MAG: purine-nucleoside/S-methyl-5-thioadenosine phosphorylase / adenosine deaminase [Actinomycetota bacterium]|nr:purine-nucleoside/S-methyl-5-thioadenosine phosphorylase / adenosine deaminase [Actinomycetota bacterium]
MLCHDETLGAVRFAFTDRYGGVSRPPYEELNLATHVGDDPAAVTENRRRVSAALGVPITWLDQVHGVTVAVVSDPLDPPPQADAQVTRTRGLALGVLVADCTPVLAADPTAGVVGVAHAGRKGLAHGVVPALLQAMAEQGATEITARVGPSICGRCYPVPAEMQEEVARAVPGARSTAGDGSPSLELAAGVVDQLTPAGVAVGWLPECSVESPDLFSYRRDGGVTGRYAGLVWLA